MIGALRRRYYSEQYNPGLLGLFINPYFLARRSLWRAIASTGGRLQGPVLDVGCGSKPYRALFKVASYVGLDIDSDLARRRGVADKLYDGNRFPFADGEFQGVLCNQVLEHVFQPDAFLEEIRRVLGPGGRLLLTVPFVWDEHEQPFDFARYTSFGLQALLVRHGFKVLEQRKLLSDFSVLAQLTIAYLFKVSRTRIPAVNLLLAVLLFAPISVAGLVLAAVLPNNPDLYLDQLVVAEKVDA